MWVQSEEPSLQIGPVPLKQAMGSLLSNIMVPLDSELCKDENMAVTLAQHGRLDFEPQGLLKGHQAAVIVRLAEGYELWTREMVSLEVMKKLD